MSVITLAALFGAISLTHCQAQVGLDNIKMAAKANLYQGFGRGYMILGDTLAARTCRWVEIGGWGAFGVGVVGLAGTKFVYDFLVASVGKVTTVDFYVFGGMAAAGLATVIASRVVSRNQVLKPSFGTCRAPSGQLIITAGLTVDL